MRKKLISVVSGVVLGLAGLLSASAQNPPSESASAPVVETYEDFIRALNAYETRMTQLTDRFRATLPWEGPLSDYQLELLAELEAPQPAHLANSSFNCLQSGGRRIDLITTLDSSGEVLVQARDTETFTAKTGWKMEKPTNHGDTHVIKFDPGLSDNRTTATADFQDRAQVGDEAPYGHVGSGRYRATCYNGGQSYSQSWLWTLFRDCPQH